jgi:hypothetical protein
VPARLWHWLLRHRAHIHPNGGEHKSCTFRVCITERARRPAATPALPCAAQVTFIVYMACLVTFVGWFIFSIYCGIGFIALPIDSIMVRLARFSVAGTPPPTWVCVGVLRSPSCTDRRCSQSHKPAHKRRSS